MIKLAFLFLTFTTLLSAQTIAEKKAGLRKTLSDLDPKTEIVLIKVNDELAVKKEQLSALYREAYLLHRAGAKPDAFEEIRKEILATRLRITELGKEWKEVAKESMKIDLYALWHQPDTTIEQLIMDFGSQEYVYVIPPEIAEIRLSINSTLPIPRAAWEEMLELLLAQNGIGIRTQGSFLRELYLTNQGSSPIRIITNKREDLEFLPQRERIAFLLTPDAQEVKRTEAFLTKFINPKSTEIKQIGRDLLILSQVSEIQDLLKLNEFIAENKSKRQYKLVPLTKIKAAEMAKVIAAMFDQLEEPTKEGGEKEAGSIKIITLDSLSQAVFLVGTADEIAKAEEMVRRVEMNIGGGTEKIVHWYVARYSSAEMMAITLQRIYDAMIAYNIGQPKQQNGKTSEANQNVTLVQEPNPDIPRTLFDNSYFLNGEAVIDPLPISPGLFPAVGDDPNSVPNTPNFIVDEKTSTIIMVIEKALLEKIMDVVQRIDIPKKMVQIDVLVFERSMRENTNYGLNLLKIGSAASGNHETGLNWVYNNSLTQLIPGILEFMISRPCTGCWPAYDLTYRFLLTQQNLYLNANPSVLTLNQTPARIAINEEISISKGINFISATNANIPQDSFARAQYGITIDVTPTLHLWSPEQDFGDNIDYVTLETEIFYDTIDKRTNPNRPDVLRRNISNEVTIADGQTVVMGGLRRKETSDFRSTIPYLGEIPGLGKLFSYTEMEDRDTELIVFMTPHIVHDPCEDLEKLKIEKVMQRPGDLPDFLCRLNESLECKQHMAFQQTMRILSGRGHSHYYSTQHGCVPAQFTHSPLSLGEYDGCE